MDMLQTQPTQQTKPEYQTPRAIPLTRRHSNAASNSDQVAARAECYPGARAAADCQTGGSNLFDRSAANEAATLAGPQSSCGWGLSRVLSTMPLSQGETQSCPVHLRGCKQGGAASSCMGGTAVYDD